MHRISPSNFGATMLLVLLFYAPSGFSQPPQGKELLADRLKVRSLRATLKYFAPHVETLEVVEVIKGGVVTESRYRLVTGRSTDLLPQEQIRRPDCLIEYYANQQSSLQSGGVIHIFGAVPKAGEERRYSQSPKVLVNLIGAGIDPQGVADPRDLNTLANWWNVSQKQLISESEGNELYRLTSTSSAIWDVAVIPRDNYSVKSVELRLDKSSTVVHFLEAEYQVLATADGLQLRIPMRIKKGKRKSGREVVEEEFIVENVEINSPVSDKEFSLDSIKVIGGKQALINTYDYKLPDSDGGTMVWDGKRYTSLLESQIVEMKPRWRLGSIGWIVCVLVALLATASAIIYLRRRGANATS